jgi:hypothetical protein
VSTKQVCGCGRPSIHGGRCAFRRKTLGKTARKRQRIQQHLNAEFVNAQGVSVDSAGFVVIESPMQRMTLRQALIHASHLILVADPSPDSQEFIDVLARVAAIYY